MSSPNLGFFPSLTISATQRKNPGRVNGADDEDDVSWSIVPILKYRGAIRNRHVYELTASRFHGVLRGVGEPG